jgi:hypothetical protein
VGIQELNIDLSRATLEIIIVTYVSVPTTFNGKFSRDEYVREKVL